MNEPVTFTAVADNIFLSSAPTMFTLVGDDSREIVRIYQDGRVVIADDVSVDEAAAAFWDALQRTGMNASRTNS